jgi:phosphatidate cytidylyltransferase
MTSAVTRTISGIIFLGIMVGSLLAGPVFAGVIFTVAVAIMTLEYLNISIPGIYLPGKILTITAGILIYIVPFLCAGYALNSKWIVIILLPITLIYIYLLYCNKADETSYRLHPYLFTPLIYIALPFSLTTIIIFRSAGEYDPTLLLTLLIFTWASDVGAYITGMSFGQKNGHKLFPSISPKKSWEGFAGGLLFAIASALIVDHFKLIESGLFHSFMIALIINLGGVVGDLAESQLKRNFDTKDSGSLMPGHGGLLDRFDGTLVSFPLAISYIIIFNIT